MNRLVNTIEKSSNRTARTHNGAVSNHSTLNACVDMFGNIGSMRARTTEDIIIIFTKAFAEDPLKAMKILFWARDIRGGAGERKVFRTIAHYLAVNHSAKLRKNLVLFVEFGRWDDLFELVGTPLEKDVVKIVRSQYVSDLKSERPSLLAKWLPSNNTSSAKTRKLAKFFEQKLNLSSKGYRKNLSALRERIKVLERELCHGDWTKIDFEKVPSRAAMQYRKAFFKNAEAQYQKFLGQVEKGEKTIKASTLYPYDIVRGIRQGGDRSLNAQWNALPNYVDPFNGIVVCDTSGSMTGSGYYGGKNDQVAPIDVALSLTLYIAERNTGDWQNKFITFSSSPALQSIQGTTIAEKVRNLSRAHWNMSTNIQAVFDLVLSTAKKINASEDEMPRTIFIVSDMQFNQACSGHTNLEAIRDKYAKAGYEMPQLVFWNVNAYGKEAPITVDDTGTCLVSGCSPAILKSVLSGEVITPVDVMNATIESPRYSTVQV